MWTLIKGAEFNQMKAKMAEMVQAGGQSQVVRNLALSIVPSYPDNQVLAVYNYVKNSVKYQPDPLDTELITSPDKMVEILQQYGVVAEDCDGIAIFTAALLRSLGYETKIAILDRQGLGFDHAAAQVFLPAPVSSWIFVDAVDTKHPMGWVPTYFAIEEVL